MTLGRDPGERSRGWGAQRYDNERIAYICCDDVVDLCERVDEYLSDTSWKVLTIDRTPAGEYYAFLTRHREN